MALQHRRRGNHEYAFKLLSAALENDTDDYYIKYNLAATCGDLGYFERAIELCKQLVIDNFCNYQVFLVLGRAYMGIGQIESAVKSYHEAKLYNKGDPTLCRELAQLTWMVSGDKEKTLNIINGFEWNASKGVTQELIKSEILGHMQEFKLQYEILVALLRKRASDQNLQYLYSKSALKNGKFEEALKYSLQVYESNKDSRDVAIHHLYCLMANGRETSAKEVVETALQAHSLDQHLIAIQAVIWRILGDSRYEQLYDYDLFVHQLPLSTPSGWNHLESYLEDLEDALNNLHCFQTHPFAQSVRKGSQVSHINKFNNRALKAYEQALSGPINEYLNRTVGAQKALSLCPRVLSAWSVKLFEDGHHTSHVHQEGWLSSACHLSFPKSQSESNQGCLTFGEPGFYTPRKVQAERLIRPKRGHVVIFPSYMWHGTIPLDSLSERLSVAADIVHSVKR